MKNIRINKDFDKHKDDVFKGFNLRQLVYFVVIGIIAILSFIFFRTVLHITNMLSYMLCFLLCFPVGIAGFLPIGGMSLTEWFRRYRDLANNGLYLDQPTFWVEEAAEDREAVEREKERERTEGKKRKPKKRKERLYFDKLEEGELTDGFKQGY